MTQDPLLVVDVFSGHSCYLLDKEQWMLCTTSILRLRLNSAWADFTI